MTHLNQNTSIITCQNNRILLHRKLCCLTQKWKPPIQNQPFCIVNVSDYINVSPIIHYIFLRSNTWHIISLIVDAPENETNTPITEVKWTNPRRETMMMMIYLIMLFGKISCTCPNEKKRFSTTTLEPLSRDFHLPYTEFYIIMYLCLGQLICCLQQGNELLSV
jgi:hypothetical protein